MPTMKIRIPDLRRLQHRPVGSSQAAETRTCNEPACYMFSPFMRRRSAYCGALDGSAAASDPGSVYLFPLTASAIWRKFAHLFCNSSSTFTAGSGSW